MIKVFNSDDKTYETNGNVVLNPTYANVHKEDNGDYYLDLETSIEEDKIKHIEQEEGTTIETTGTTLTDVDTTKEHKFISLYGETQQDSTTQGKNLFDGILELGGYRTNGAKLSANDNYRNANPVKVQPNTTYTMSINGVAQQYVMLYYQSNGTFISIADNRTGTFTTPNNCYLVNFRCYVADFTSDYSSLKVQCELGSSATSWEAFVPNSPSPDYPQPIHNVSGDNTIEICGKNRLKSSDLYIFNSNKYIATTNYTTKGVIKVQPNTTYSISFEGVRGALSDRKIYSYDKNNVRTQLSLTNTEGSDYTLYSFTTLNDTETIGFYIGGTTAYNSVEEFLSAYKLMLINGNTFLSYEAYTGNSQLISLGVENLVNVNDTTITSSTNLAVIDTSNINGSITLSIDYNNTSNVNGVIRFTNGSSTNYKTVVATANTSGNLTMTLDVSSYNSVTLVAQGVSSGYSYSISNVAVNKGTTPQHISTTPIELNKIDTYQDYIYKNNDKWYLHKEIGKVVFNGSESWTISTSYTYNVFYRTLDNYARISNTQTTYCEYYKGIENTAGIVDFGNNYNNSIGVRTANDNIKDIYISNNSITSASDFKTWLSTHNTIVYYILAEPTDTEITDTTLLEQLNNFEKMRLYEGITNISITPNDLAPITKLHYNYMTGGDVVINNNDYIKSNNIIVANTPTGEQAFRITDIEKRKHKIVLKAWHISYDTKNYVIQDSYVVDKTCNQAMDHLNNATDNTSPFTTTSDITTINSYRCVRRSLFEAFNVVLERWGGHFVRDNWNFKIMNSIGQDNGVVVRYAKNLKDIQVTYDWTNVVTKLLPVGNDGLLLDEVFLYADIQYDIPYTKVVHFDQNINEDAYRDEQGVIDEDAYLEALKNDLRSQATLYLQNNYLPQVNYSLNANLEKITDIGDTIQVKDERLGVDITTNLISYDYDCILEKYTNLEFGNFTKTISDLTSYINSQTSQIVDESLSTTRITLENELETATSQIWGVLGSSYVLNEGDKILIVDSLPKETATNVIMINSAGIGFSQTGINGTFSTALTIDGTFNTSNVNVINFTADLIKGGVLKLGSNLNQNGILEVYDEANNLIAVLNKDGLRMNAVNGAYVLINQQVGFAGYDKNDNPIYWVSEDEFHMKKSVVEEEITLVDKMRIIPITITDNGTIVNDGIGFVSTL